eukprot:CAMPEP_0198311322 /NCGR_PEP_ID=MMETSP1450-20131203/3079_1 /TAXON_ID=753684 ORGANISM="Madagascaria erythrocladiodes, Strain CCMP3234" /NCGR_SAMPLE_ID=MMETSP1450 /ASSEMBLY_ACC=CAM_ASM_001115 /LENGTH=43 /DNA_ID= /DNA_START= /DNA_END= /DNA_ORIENTATION=
MTTTYTHAADDYEPPPPDVLALAAIANDARGVKRLLATKKFDV